MRNKSLLSVMLLSTLISAGGSRADEEKEAEFYTPLRMEIEGWTIWLDPRLKDPEHAEVGTKSLQAMSNHLYKITMVVPETSLEKLKTIPIRLELDNDVLGNMQYHPSVNWLKENGHDPALVKTVHMPFAHRLYEKENLLKHPWVVLHELAHGYHDQILGFDYEPVMKAYQKAKAAGINKSVLLYTGKNVEHYAETNHKEYFAEMTEAYFGLNDFYPFMHAELKTHDPQMYAVLEDIWGKRSDKKKFYEPLKLNLEGWTVWLDPRLKSEDGQVVGRKALGALANHLQKISMVVPEKSLKDLQKVQIRLELNNKRFTGMQYHGSKEWLIKNGHDPALAKNVHIPFAESLYDKSSLLKHPWVVLHELAHGYHDQVLGSDYEPVKKAYLKAKTSGINQSVLTHAGVRRIHYAEKNSGEYFAEMTEAYFGLNDFYPFMRAQLKKHDPEMFAVLEKVWGTRP